MILVVVMVAALWIGAGALLVGTLAFRGADRSSENVRTDLTAEFEYMLSKNMSGVGQIDAGNVAFAPVKRAYSLNYLVTFLAQCDTRLCAGIVKFCRLSDDNRTGAYYQNFLQVITLWHFVLSSRFYKLSVRRGPS